MLSESMEAVRRAVDALGVEFEWIPIDPDYADTAVFCKKYGFPPEKSANTIIVASRKEPRTYAACVVLATTRLDVNNRVRRLMGVNKASFASAEQMAGLTGMVLGGVTPFGLPGAVPLYIDARVMACDYVIVGAGGRGAKVRVAPDALAALPGATVVDGLAMELPA